MKKFLKPIFLLVALGVLIYVFRAPLGGVVTQLEAKFRPCAQPIPYMIASFDTRFGISKNTFLGAIQEAEQIWEKPIGKQLFANDPGGYLKINLIYDNRQAATVKLQTLGIAVNDDRASYDALEAKYHALMADYVHTKADYEARLAAFNAHQSAYEAEINSWNERGGAPRNVYVQLNEERAALAAEADALNSVGDSLNAKADDVNAVASALNRLAEILNLKVAQFNQIGSSRGSEFAEGTYQSGPGGQEIDIYQFDDRGKLVRVLAHELGHALGLDHLENPKAIMYRLNEGTNEKLTADDLTALKNRCGIK